jgi:hypothetical protein
MVQEVRTKEIVRGVGVKGRFGETRTILRERDKGTGSQDEYLFRRPIKLNQYFMNMRKMVKKNFGLPCKRGK